MCNQIDWKKPIEMFVTGASWREAKVIDDDYNGMYLIKYKNSTGTWSSCSVHSTTVAVRNVPEKKAYTVIVLRNGTQPVFAITRDPDFNIEVGESARHTGYPSHTVIGVHKGEYCV